ncbi:hypothetical protein C1645_780503 [Glomus cerebriforme]|uniref:F-box domain-containing protein n=1 Tax=Glomus cerebriforme TaxID=658196 RepID=A0A397STQ1_9GLOM|nr:hypothetical protein C1645_780503 [Glomus cerebriforme]
MAKLTHDCLYIVFEELENDINTLYSCLLVNRTVCETVVPILWRNPWKFCRNASIYKLKRLYYPIISLLPADSKLLLINNDINLFNPFSPKPLFNYISFFKTLNANDVDHMIKDLTELTHIKFNPNNKILLGQEVMKMIMNFSSHLRILLLHKCNVKEFYTFPGAKECLKNIVKLECTINLEPSVYHGLAKICRNIKYLFVNNCIRDNEGIAALIEAQKNLQYFKYEKFYINYPLCKRIGSALEKSADSLISFEAYGNIAICCSTFTKLVNLKILKLKVDLSNGCQEQFLRTLSLPNLQQLNLSCHSLHTISKIIQQTKGDLMEIRIGSEKNISRENTLMLIKSITQHCPNLNLATIICYDHEDIKELKRLFSVCTKLKKLVLIHYYFNTNYEVYDDDLLQIIAECAPPNLSSLKVECFNFSTKNLESFFEKWKMKQQTPLSFYNISEEEYFLFNNEKNNVIKKYIKEGVIKKFEEIDPYDRFTDWD